MALPAGETLLWSSVGDAGDTHTHTHSTTWKKPQRTGHRLRDSSHVRVCKSQSPGHRERAVAARGCVDRDGRAPHRGRFEVVTRSCRRRGSGHRPVHACAGVHTHSTCNGRSEPYRKPWTWLTAMGQHSPSVATDVSLWQGTWTVGWLCACVGRATRTIPAPASQFCCEPATALKIKPISKIKKK